MYHLHRSQLLHCSLAEAWDFFATPRNLDKLTPRSIDFKITHCESEIMHRGQMIGYKVRIAPCLWVKWLTEITHMEPQRFFIDDQRIGPYKVWHHTHHFEETPEGVLMRDDVIYDLPYGFIGKCVHAVYVRAQLEYIFNERQRLASNIFNASIFPPNAKQPHKEVSSPAT